MNATPCLVIRGVTDTPITSLETQRERFRTNTPLVMARAWETLAVCIAHYLKLQAR